MRYRGADEEGRVGGWPYTMHPPPNTLHPTPMDPADAEGSPGSTGDLRYLKRVPTRMGTESNRYRSAQQDGPRTALLVRAPRYLSSKHTSFTKGVSGVVRVCPRISKCVQEHLEVCLGRAKRVQEGRDEHLGESEHWALL